MSTLLLRFNAPLQAWGTEARYEVSSTRREPSKSGVTGMIAAALGCPRDQYPSELNALRFGVRVDREGELICDFQTAKSSKDAYVTYRYYLCDALFLVGLEGEEALLKRIAYALLHPQFPLYLGRRSCPPTGKLVLGLREKGLTEALMCEPSLDGREKTAEALRILVDAEPGDRSAFMQKDVIISLNPMHRSYGFRGVREKMIEPPESHTHDPMAELEEAICT